ncbi:MAG: N-succinyldiaminopimelate aminotransferase [Solirubrobacteraceae bacterium]|nr:N-succinyldiaminopimelate aminotransferase [Solirubrobacteraceae bacterium]
MPAERLAGFGTSVFTEMSALAERTGSINLGQGFPDEDGPAAVLDAACAALHAGANQYAPLPGVPALRLAIAEHQRSRYGLEHDPDTEVQVTFGATEAIAAALLGLCDPGDEVLALDPAYDSYAAGAALAGARLRRVPLHPPEWRFDAAELEAAVTDRTRLVLLNSPHNPTGRVLARSELEAVAAVCREHDLIAVTDEVYEHLVFEGEHVPLATLPGMAERTLTISSIGKTFSVTGWKIGWACGPAELVGAVRGAKQFMTFAGGTPLQHAAAVALGIAEAHGARLAAELKSKRDRLCAGLERAGFEVLRPAGTYFVNVDVSADAVAFCRDLPERAGVVGIPTSVFSTDPERVRTLVRFAFCKREEVIDEAAERLAAMR